MYRITLNTPVLAGKALTRIDFGHEHQLTRTGPRELEQGLTTAGAKFVELSASYGATIIFLNKTAISAVRSSDPHQDPPGSNAVIMVQEQRQAVQRTLQEMRQPMA